MTKRATPEYVDHSLKKAMTGTFPGDKVPEGMRLCLGAGTTAPDDWICLDKMKTYPPLAKKRLLANGYGKGKCDLRKLDWIPDGSAAVVYAHHVIEHMDPTTWEDTLVSWAKKTMVGGYLYLGAPDLLAIAARIVETNIPGGASGVFDLIPSYTFKGDDRKFYEGPADNTKFGTHEWHFLYAGSDHLSVSTGKQVRDVLEANGFEVRRFWDRPDDYSDIYSKLFVANSYTFIAKRIE